MALTVALTRESKYRDGDLELQSDGTWLLLLRAHEGADGAGLESPWNLGLYNCYARRVPVGVFLPKTGSDYEWLGLALVDDYDDGTQTFLLHGPVRSESSAEDWGTLDPIAETGKSVPDWFIAEEPPHPWLDTRSRRPTTSVVRQRQSSFRDLLLRAYRHRCAVTPCDVPVALDAAHILPYLGRGSDTARNGLVLRADLHRLFDRYLIAVDTRSMCLLVSAKLERSAYSDMHGRDIRLPSDARYTPSIRHLDLHRERFARTTT